MLKDAHHLMKLYKPVQPSAGTESGVVYREYKPDVRLQPFIYCYWQLYTPQPLDTSFHYRVVADGCIDLFFEQNNPTESFVMGFSDRYTEYPLGTSFHYAGVRFLPAMFPFLFKVDAGELNNRAERLNDVLPKVAKFLSQQNDDSIATEDRNLKMDSFFLQYIQSSDHRVDSRLCEAIAIILRNAGLVSIETGLDAGISPRQLRRLFQFYIGDTPKSFSRVIRFQHMLNSGLVSRQDSITQHLYDAGYYDQAHFIREFKKFYGVTPGRVFSA